MPSVAGRTRQSAKGSDDLVGRALQAEGATALPRLAARARDAAGEVLPSMAGISCASIAARVLEGRWRMVGIYVGSRKSAQNLYRFVESSGIRPVIDGVFVFGESREACGYLAGTPSFS